ncbi:MULTISPECIES: thioredoxin [Flavobacterium]|uniref:thioredoxin n=1 Tax=Flavobacterium TaxID=237 RepID=UPI00086A65C0|nr:MULTISPECIES: thioredoxin [Flavobacterium]MBN9284663.1 thioredoxin [Flavobacterium sp.]ODS86854.1 MAG: thioredoxin [Chryseobacterium sp. SCN 40-13]OJV72590.1 MAG: thioredoxin [Flavobacterium sp. 40-81]
MSTFSEITNRKEPVLIDFFATWCQPCTALAPVLKEAKAVLGDTAHILKIDIDKNQDLAAKYQIKSVPTMLLFKEGRQLWRHSGIITKDALISVINSHKS